MTDLFAAESEGWALHLAGWMRREGIGGPKDPAAALPLVERACALGESGGWHAGDILANGQAGPPNAALAKSYFVQGCQLGHDGCCDRAK